MNTDISFEHTKHSTLLFFDANFGRIIERFVYLIQKIHFETLNSFIFYQIICLLYSISKNIIAVILLVLSVIIIFVVLKMLLFLNKMQNMTSVNINFQKMLFINMVSQIFLTAIFQIIPFIALFVVTYFKIMYAGQITTIVFNIVAFHAPVEMIFTLYLVRPYREYLLFKVIRSKSNLTTTVILPSVSRI